MSVAFVFLSYEDTLIGFRAGPNPLWSYLGPYLKTCKKPWVWAWGWSGMGALFNLLQKVTANRHDKLGDFWSINVFLV